MALFIRKLCRCGFARVSSELSLKISSLSGLAIKYDSHSSLSRLAVVWPWSLYHSFYRCNRNPVLRNNKSPIPGDHPPGLYRGPRYRVLVVNKCINQVSYLFHNSSGYGEKTGHLERNDLTFGGLVDQVGYQWLPRSIARSDVFQVQEAK